MSVLKLSTVWDFAAIRTTAIKALEMYGKEDPVLRIIIAKKYNIPEWFVPAVNALAQRKEALKEEEMKRLLDLGSMWGVCRFLRMLSEVRESCYETTSSDSSYCSWEGPPNPSIVTPYPVCGIHQKSLISCEIWSKPYRSEYDFTRNIAVVFGCQEQTPKSEHGTVFLPQEVSWNFI
jgi:hypothetical protein